jgi:hypothetical protein
VTRAERIAAYFRQAIAGAITDSKDTLDQIAVDGGNAASDGIVGSVGDIFSFLGSVLGLLPGLGPAESAALDAIKTVAGGGGKLGSGFGHGYLVAYALWQLLEPVTLPIKHFVNAATTNEIFDPQTAADLVARKIITSDFGGSESSGGGLDVPHFNQLAEAALVFPALPETIELLRRGQINADQAIKNLHRNKIPPDQVDHLLSLARTLLTPADLALAELRGAITSDQAKAYALTLGVDPADFDTLVANTGEPLGLMELLEAYRRDFIDRDTLERGIRQSRVRNEWIDTAEKLRYSPMSTADAVRAVVENYITADQGAVFAQQNGLMPEHWPILVESWGRPLAHMEMASLVHRGLASRSQFDQAMRESDIKDKYIGQSFEVATRLLPERLIVTAIRYGAITLQDGSKRLLQLGYEPENVAILLKLGLAEQHGASHALTRTQIGQLYADGILKRADAIAKLVALKYSQQDAEYMLQLLDTQAHAKELKAETAAIRVSYLANGIDAVRAEQQLTALGIAPDQAQHLIHVWDREKHRAARVLSEAQVVKAAKNKTITPADALSLLVAAGYDQHDASILLVSNGVVFTTPASTQAQ